MLAICKNQKGASLIEFSIVGLSVVLAALFTLQMGLIYHAKTTLNYAVFEAARSGAVNNGSVSAMRTELGYRLAPLQGGDGTRKKALIAIAKSKLKINDPFNTELVILNPTKAAFKDWAVRDSATGERFIPVNHLRHQTHAVGKHSGLSLRDANILKLQVTHGFSLHVPVVGKLMAGAMKWIDAQNSVFYLRDKWPLQAVATVRMQSNSLESEILSSAVTGGVSDDGSSGTSSTTGGAGSTGEGGTISVAEGSGNTGSGGLGSGTAGGPVQSPEEGGVEDEASAPDSNVAQNESNGEEGPVDGVTVDSSHDCTHPYALADTPDQQGKAVQGAAGLIGTSQFRQMLAQGVVLGVSGQLR